MKKFLLTFIVGSLCISSITIYTAFFSCDVPYSYFIDPLLSDECINLLESCVKECVSQGLKSYDITAAIQKDFSFLEKTTISYTPHGAFIDVIASMPQYVVNDSFVYIGHEIIPKKYFSDNALRYLPVITITDEYLSSTSSFLSEVGTQFVRYNDRYDVTIYDKHCLKLIDKKQPHFSIILTAEQKIPENMPDIGSQVKQYLNNKKAFDKNESWAADMRFAGYVFAYKT